MSYGFNIQSNGCCEYWSPRQLSQTRFKMLVCQCMFITYATSYLVILIQQTAALELVLNSGPTVLRPVYKMVCLALMLQYPYNIHKI